LPGGKETKNIRLRESALNNQGKGKITKGRRRLQDWEGMRNRQRKSARSDEGKGNAGKEKTKRHFKFEVGRRQEKSARKASSVKGMTPGKRKVWGVATQGRNRRREKKGTNESTKTSTRGGWGVAPGNRVLLSQKDDRSACKLRKG